MSLRFERIGLKNWRQFDAVFIDVHPQLTIITGSNGAGKSTILNIFSQHFGYSRPFLSTPKRKKGGGIIYDLGYYDSKRDADYSFIGKWDNLTDDEYVTWHDQNVERIAALLEPPPVNGQFVEIGQIDYDNHVTSSIGYHEQQVNSYGITISHQQNVVGVSIGSHRTVSNYQAVQGLSLTTLAISDAYNAYANEYWSRMNGGQTGYSTIYRMKESLIAMAAFGDGNTHLEPNKELSKAFLGFIEILKKVLPEEIGFQNLVVRLPDIVMKTITGEFILDSGSGGINAVIEISWQLYLFSLTNPSFVATLDEPENHLHPSMQRSILSNLIRAFPNVQFIVATHSPFIVSAVEDSYVYALRFANGNSALDESSNTPQRRVRSVKLDQTTKSGSASEILKEVLGVSVSIPDWAQSRLDGIVRSYENIEIDTATLKALRIELTEAGFSEFYPEALAKLVEGR